MTNATQILRHEHDAILKMLDVAEETARQLNANRPVSPYILSGLLEFLQVFADRCHHGKEEDHLFPLLVKKGMPSNGGPIGVMLHEHECGRALIRRMAEATTAFAAGDAAAGKNWADAAVQYADLLREHISKENNILFVMAERFLSPADQEALAGEFEKVELEKLGVGTHERLHTLMEKLSAEVLP